MTFTTVTYLLFLGIVFGAYWALRRRRPQNLLLIVASYGFYAWWDWRYCGLMLVSTLVDFAAGLGIASGRRRRVWLGVSLLVNLGMLGFFKYFGFFVETFGAAFASIGIDLHPTTLRFVLPVGISFYTFQTLGYTIDVYRGRAQACRSPVDYFVYVSFFPQLVAGPIERANHLLGQFAAPRHFDRDLATDGCRQILWGMAKKMLLADNLALIVDAAYGAPATASGPQLVFATIAFASQIYCDFSAYSDIAIGTSKLFGIDLMRNFAYPYFSQSVGEFWRRWHISLSTWFRDYVYIPMGGSRFGRRRLAAAILVTFTVSGLWHGASWNFVIWGAIHGLALLPEALRSGKRPRRLATDLPGGPGWLPRPAVVARMAGTFLFVLLAWVFFRASTLSDATLILGRIGRDLFDGSAWATTWKALRGPSWLTTKFLLGFIAIEWLQRSVPHGLARLPRWRAVRWLIYTLIIWGTLYHVAPVLHPFIYFQF